MKLLVSASTLDWSDWLTGLVGAFVSGGAGAVGSAVGVTIALPGQTLHTIFVIMATTFIVSALISLAKFLQVHPTPSPKTTVSVATTTQAGVPPKTTTTVSTETDSPKP